MRHRNFVLPVLLFSTLAVHEIALASSIARASKNLVPRGKATLRNLILGLIVESARYSDAALGELINDYVALFAMTFVLKFSLLFKKVTSGFIYFKVCFLTSPLLRLWVNTHGNS